jgi:hypothetical protein
MATENTEVQINNMNTMVRAVDGDSLLAPQTMEKIVRAVLQAVNEQEEHHKRVRAERRITGGVSHERDEEER